MQKLKFILTLLIGKGLMLFSNIFAKGRGTNMPGAKANRIMPRSKEHTSELQSHA